MVRHAPHEEIPVNAVANLINAHAFSKELQPRFGAYLYSETQPPVLPGANCGDAREGYTLSQSGTTVTSHSGAIFSEADVSNYIVFPGEPNVHLEIQEYLSTTTVLVNDNVTREATGGCWMHGRLNVNDYQPKAKKRVRLWGQHVYWADNTAPNTWHRAYCVSREQPANVYASYDNIDDYALIANSTGVFKLDFEPETPLLWKINSVVPTMLINDVARSGTIKIRHDYTYSMSRLSQSGIRQRTTRGVKILQESGTCVLNPTYTPPKDYGTRWHENKIGPDVKTNGKLTGGVLADAQQSPNYWAVTIPAPGATFGITINERTENFIIDFGPGGYNVTNLHEVARAIQTEVRMVFPFFTCEYLEGGFFVMTSGEEDHSTIDYVSAGIGGTDISALMMLTAATADSVSNTNIYESSYTVESLNVPTVATEATVRQQHWTHYTIYRTTDIGFNGVTPRVNEATGEDLVPLTFTWVRDLRISAAFYGSKDVAGLVTAEVGTFEEADVGTALEWEDGDVDTIIEYIDSGHVKVSTAGHYYETAKPLQAIAIGGGKVIRASQADGVITIESVYNNLRFSCDDVGKTITWSTGEYSVIIEYISPTQVRVADDIDKNTQGITLDAVSRNFTDLTTDAELRDRQGERHVGLLNHRFWMALPNSNIIRIVPGFLLVAQRLNKKVYYSQIEVQKSYLAGYHLELEQQIDKIQEPVHEILKAPNYFVVLCDKTTWGGPTNNPDIVKLPEFGEEYAVLHVDVIDNAIGCVDFKSIQEIIHGVFEMHCSDDTWRQFSNLRYSEDLSVIIETGQDAIKKDLKELWNLFTSSYSKILGHIIWGRRR